MACFRGLLWVLGSVDLDFSILQVEVRERIS